MSARNRRARTRLIAAAGIKTDSALPRAGELQ